VCRGHERAAPQRREVSLGVWGTVMNHESEFQTVKRTLRTILAVEVVDFTSHMNAAEEDTVVALARHRTAIDSLIASRGGRVFTTAPNNVLAEFESPVEAARCALEIQESVGSLHYAAEARRPLRFRIGIHTGDVLRTGDNLLGDAVNIAARLEGIAEPDSIFISREVKEFIEAKLTVQFRFQGNKALKNIPRPVAAYEISAMPITGWRLIGRQVRRFHRKLLVALSLAIVLCGLAYLAYDSTQRIRSGVSAQITPETGILDKDPAPGTLAYGKKVLVNDGSCPTGQIKEVTGGNNNINIPRSNRCIDRP
jgi:class 3 adenylate cyclase